MAVYLGALMRWNRSVNLVGARSWRQALDELVADSWFLAEFLDSLDLPDHPLIYDLGAGAGLPGAPLRMLWSRGEYVMVEIRAKRSAFLQYVLGQLRLERTRAEPRRAEDVLAQRAPDAALSRAFMPWPKFLDLLAAHKVPRAVVMASEPAPKPRELAGQAHGWEVNRQTSYKAGGKRRYFWSFWALVFSR